MKRFTLITFFAVLAAFLLVVGVQAATVNLAKGGTTVPIAGSGSEYIVQKYMLNMATNNLTSANNLRIFNIPTGCQVLGIRAKVTTADSVAAATADVGLYKVSDDSAVDADGIINELAIGATGTTFQAAATAANCTTQYDEYVGIVQGASGGGATNNDAVIEFTISYINYQ